MSYQQHMDEAKQIALRCAVVTFSDTRTIDTDVSGEAIVALLATAKHAVVERLTVREDLPAVHLAMTQLLDREDVDVILTTGGTGVSRRDITIDIIQRLLDRSLPGFGELFRMLSYQQIGSGALLSRAIAGVAHGKVIFAMPGSTSAVELAMQKLILPELKHLVAQLKK